MTRGLLSTASAIALGLMITTVDVAKADPASDVLKWEFYLGLHGGAGWLDGNFGTATTKPGIELDRGLFGALAGVNLRKGYWLFGLEGDVGFASKTNVKGGLCDSPLSCSAKMNYHFRARFGRMVTPNIDLFAAIGVALLHAKFNEFGTKHDRTLTGLSLGAGADIKVGMPGGFNPVIRLEALYDMYGKQDFGPTYAAKNWNDFTVRAAAVFPF